MSNIELISSCFLIYSHYLDASLIVNVFDFVLMTAIMVLSRSTGQNRTTHSSVKTVFKVAYSY